MTMNGCNFPGQNIASISEPEDNDYYSYTKMSNLVKGTYVFQLKANVFSSVAYDTVAVNVVDDDRRGKEFVIESAWEYVWDDGLYAVTPVNYELFYPTSGNKMTVYIQLENTSDWIDLSLPLAKYVVYPNYCAHLLWINTTEFQDSTSPLIGQKLLIKVRYD
jgi:hypothetical protein